VTKRDSHTMSQPGGTSPERSHVYAGSYPLVITNLGYVTNSRRVCHTNQPLCDFRARLPNNFASDQSTDLREGRGHHGA